MRRHRSSLTPVVAAIVGLAAALPAVALTPLPGTAPRPLLALTQDNSPAPKGAVPNPAMPQNTPAQNAAPRDRSPATTGATPRGGADQPAAAPSSEPEERPLYEGQMLRLAEVLGALSFLRNLCNASDAPLWYEKMRALMEAEAGSQAERERLAGAFNRGFNGYAITYRRCNASAEAAVGRFLEEGERLATTISSRFGG